MQICHLLLRSPPPPTCIVTVRGMWDGWLPGCQRMLNLEGGGSTWETCIQTSGAVTCRLSTAAAEAASLGPRMSMARPLSALPTSAARKVVSAAFPVVKRGRRGQHGW